MIKIYCLVPSKLIFLPIDQSKKSEDLDTCLLFTFIMSSFLFWYCVPGNNTKLCGLIPTKRKKSFWHEWMINYFTNLIFLPYLIAILWEFSNISFKIVLYSMICAQIELKENNKLKTYLAKELISNKIVGFICLATFL